MIHWDLSSAPLPPEALALWLDLLRSGAPAAAGATPLLGLGLGRRRRAPPADRPDRTVRAALPMLPAEVRAVVTAALAEHEVPAEPPEAAWAARSGRGRPPRPSPAAIPPYLFVVRFDHPGAFTSLRELAWTRPDLLGVAFDRRWRGDRRCQDRPGPVERRGGERRRPERAPSWQTLGFVLVESGRPGRLRAGEPPAGVPATAEPAPPVRRPLALGGRATRLGLGGLLLLSVATLLVLARRPDGPPGEEHSAPPPREAPALPSPPAPAASPPEPRGAVRPREPRAAPPAPPRAPSTPAGRAKAPSGPAGSAAAATPQGAGVPADRCVPPPAPTVAVGEQGVLGPVVGVKIDASGTPARCLYVVEREDGVLWAIDSAHVRLVPR